MNNDMYEGIQNLFEENPHETISESDEYSEYEGISDLFEEIPLETLSESNEYSEYEGVSDLFEEIPFSNTILDINDQYEGIAGLYEQLSLDTIHILRIIGFSLERQLQSLDSPVRRYFEQLIRAKYHPDAVAEENVDYSYLADLMYETYESVQDDYEGDWTDNEDETIKCLEDISTELFETLDNPASSVVGRVIQDGMILAFNKMLQMTRDIFNLDLDEFGNVIRTAAGNSD